MSQKPVRLFALPAELELKIQSVLHARFGLHLHDTDRIAEAIKKNSDYYIENPAATTPWNERWCQIAQLTYFLPLNTLRLQAILFEARHLGFLDDVDEIVDFGAGLGPLAWAMGSAGPRKEFEFIERSADAQGLARDLGLSFRAVAGLRARPRALLAFSYSFTELAQLPPGAEKFESLLIVEPSTRQDGRRLLEVRKNLLRQGFSMWAPCPHQASCPLLEKNPHDWCHDRIHFDRPAWLLDVEKRLPFENPTLTFSYLLASKRPSPLAPGQIRLVGDVLREKGKTRQMICRGPEREFFAWLSRDGQAPEWPRGILVQAPKSKSAGNELRPQEDLLVTDFPN